MSGTRPLRVRTARAHAGLVEASWSELISCAFVLKFLLVEFGLNSTDVYYETQRLRAPL